MDYLDESVEALYSDPDIIAMTEQAEADMQYQPQEYGVVEATLFD